MGRPSDAEQIEGSESSPGGRSASRRFRATVEYDGTEFAGFQVQPGQRTVQGVLETALARLSGGTRHAVDGAGRTDAGVHAAGQIVAFDYDGPLSAEALVEALNGNLPRDVAIRDLRPAPAGFQPRRVARYREYRYTIWNGSRSPLRERTAWWVRQPLDATAMARVATVFQGRHDFRAFGGADPQTLRTVHSIRVGRRGDTVTVDVRAQAFLRGMVRRIVWALVKAGAGQLDEARIRAALGATEPAFGGAAAPASGLCLRRVALGRPTARPQTTTAARTRTIEER